MSVAAQRSDAILERLLTLHPKRIDLVLDRIERLLAALGHPERKMPPVIHVAGTNGKGSTCAFSRAILEAQGLKVHVYTSPHLVHFHERIRLASGIIGEDELAATLDDCERANAGEPITFFEITTATAFLAFSRHPADALKAPVLFAGQDFFAHAEHGRMVYQDGDALLDLPLPRLAGPHQIENAATAIAGLRHAGKGWGREDAVEQGLCHVEWPARLQRLSKGPLVTLVPQGSEVWLDGGHNPHAAHALARALADFEERSPKPLYLICGMLKTKDAQGYFAPFRGLARHRRVRQRRARCRSERQSRRRSGRRD